MGKQTTLKGMVSGILCRSSDYRSVLTLPRAWVLTLVGKLRPSKPHGTDKKKGHVQWEHISEAITFKLKFE